jgi:hypothetical protein
MFLETMRGHAKITRVQKYIPPYLPALKKTAPVKYSKNHIDQGVIWK